MIGTNLPMLDEVEWNGEGILQCDGHVDLDLFAGACTDHHGGEGTEGHHTFIRNCGERNGYDEWWESCKSYDEGAKPVTQEIV